MYNPISDFLALVRGDPSGEIVLRMPGLDYVVAAMSRAGMFKLYVGQVTPTVNQPTTVWIMPSLPSWVAEGTVYLWDPSVGAYAVATASLWLNLFSSGGYLFQSVATASDTVGSGVTVLAVQRAGPTATSLLLPNLKSQWLTGRALKIVDWSTAVANHTITLATPDGSTIMRLAQWRLLSSAAQLAGVTLHAVPDLNGWIIAP